MWPSVVVNLHPAEVNLLPYHHLPPLFTKALWFKHTYVLAYSRLPSVSSPLPYCPLPAQGPCSELMSGLGGLRRLGQRTEALPLARSGTQ